MKKQNLILLAALSAILTGCIVTSVYPFYTPKDLAYDQALVGTWTKTDDADEHWKFEAAGTNAYHLTYTSKSDTNVMVAHRFTLGGAAFLDLISTVEIKDVQPPPIPSHYLLRIFQTSPTLKMAGMNYDWLCETVTNNPSAVRHCIIQGDQNDNDVRLVLTADTAELQKFILKHLKTEKAWKDELELKADAASK